jgi:hypothetical protein
MARFEDAAAQAREALRDATEWANDLDAPLAREDVTHTDVEAHAMDVNSAAVRRRPEADDASSLPVTRLPSNA